MSFFSLQKGGKESFEFALMDSQREEAEGGKHAEIHTHMHTANPQPLTTVLVYAKADESVLCGLVVREYWPP